MNMQNVEQLSARFNHEVWEKDMADHGRWGRLGVFLTRLAYGIVHKFTDGDLSLWAMSLVYTTLLSLVPLLAVSFSVVTAFGGRYILEPLVMDFLAPLGERGEEIGERILSFVGNIEVGVLGFVGVAFLFYTVISLIQKIEEAFNAIWHVSNIRSLARRFSDYLSVILIGPVLLGTALAVTATVLNSAVVVWLSSIEPFGTLILGLSRLLPYLLVCGAFMFLYGFIPNTRVRPGAAVVGGIFAGVLWYTTGLLFTAFVVNSANYSAIYSSFAGIILFMLWLYIGWLIILVGAQVAFYWQNPGYLDPLHGGAAQGSRRRMGVALEIMTLVGRAHYYNETPWTFEALKTQIHSLHPNVLADLVRTMERRRLIVKSDAKPPAYLPAHDIETIPLKEVVTAVRGEAGFHCGLPSVDSVINEIDAAIDQVLEGRTVKDLVLSGQERPDEENHEGVVESQERPEKVAVRGG